MRNASFFAAMIILVLGYSGCSQGGADSSELQSLKAELQKVKDEKATVEKRLAEFDKLDFEYYGNQKWDLFGLSHAGNIKVIYPDGSETVGLAQHIDQLKPQFVFAPDTKIGSLGIAVMKQEFHQ